MKKKKRALSDCPPWSVQVAITKDFSLDSLKTMQMNWSQFERVGSPQPRHQVKAFLPAEGRETPTGLCCESSYFHYAEGVLRPSYPLNIFPPNTVPLSTGSIRNLGNTSQASDRPWHISKVVSSVGSLSSVLG